MQTRATSNHEKGDDGSVTVNYFQGSSFDIGQTIDQKTLLTCLLAAKESCPQENSALCCCTRKSALGGRLVDVVNTYCCFEIQCARPSLRPRPPVFRYIRRWICTSSTGEYLWITELPNRPVDIIHGESLEGYPRNTRGKWHAKTMKTTSNIDGQKVAINFYN